MTDLPELGAAIRVAPVTPEPLSQPGCLPRQQAGPGRNPARRPGASSQIPLHRLPIAPNFGRNPPRAPT